MQHATTKVHTPLARALDREVGAFRIQLRKASEGDVRGVHRARVASRRLREMLPVVAFVLPGGESRQFSRDVRRVAQALGAVRELDVAIGVLEEEAGEHQWRELIVARVRRHLEAERAARFRRVGGVLDRVEPPKLIARGDALTARLDDLPGRTGWERALSERVQQRAALLGEAIAAVGTMYVPDRLHAARIAAKKLRYVLEAGQRCANWRVGRDLSKLKAVQAQLGRLHDLQILQEQIQILMADALHQPAILRGLGAITETFEVECRALHARFLATVGRLDELAIRHRRATYGAGRPLKHALKKSMRSTKLDALHLSRATRDRSRAR